MAFEARGINVLIASPGDTTDARDAAERTVLGWNRDRARQQKVVLLPLRWEVDAVPELGTDAQSVINRQLVDEADVVIGLFYSRLGKPTARGDSGTVEEIEKSIERGARVHVYFSEMPLPTDVDTEQLERLREFKSRLQAEGLVGSYASLEDLATKIRTALEADVRALAGDVDSGGLGVQPKAILRARYESDREPDVDSKGRMRMKTRRQRLILENLGTGPAEEVSISIEPIGRGRPPEIVGPAGAERLPPRSSISLLLSVTMGVASQWRVTIKWREGDTGFEESQTVTSL